MPSFIMPFKSTAPGTITWYNTHTIPRVITHDSNKSTSYFSVRTYDLNGLTMEKIKTADKVSISITRVKSITVGLKETENNKALPAVSSVIDHDVVIF